MISHLINKQQDILKTYTSGAYFNKDFKSEPTNIFKFITIFILNAANLTKIECQCFRLFTQP